jgi:hypothetical protein
MVLIIVTPTKFILLSEVPFLKMLMFMVNLTLESLTLTIWGFYAVKQTVLDYPCIISHLLLPSYLKIKSMSQTFGGPKKLPNLHPVDVRPRKIHAAFTSVM